MADAAIATGSKPSRLAPRDATRLITAAERSFYGEQGYLRVDRPMVDTAAIKEVRDILDGLFADADAPEGYVHELGAVGTYGSVPEIIWPSLLRPQLKRTKVFAMMRELALELLDVDRVRLHFDHAIFKPPLNAGPTAWHQDVVFDPTHDCPVATIWFALVEATEENGCMMFIPGSHRGEIHEHVPYGKDGRQSVDVSTDKKVVCPLPAGGLTVHQQRTLHAAGPNHSSGTRAAWIVKLIPDDRNLARRTLSDLNQKARRLVHAKLPPPVG